MVETYPYVFEFTVAGGLVVFDFSQNRVLLRLEDEEREFPAPVNLHNFCVVMGGILYEKSVARKQVFIAGKPGERKVMELRGIIYEKVKRNRPDGEDPERREQSRDQGGDGQVEEQPLRKRPRAVLTFIDETANFKRSFLLNIFNLYALWELFRMQDKVVSAGDLVFERREGNVFIQGIPLPFQKAKATFHALDTFLKTGSIPAINQGCSGTPRRGWTSSEETGKVLFLREW